MTTPPDLIVEIASPGNKSYDLKTKRDAYEKFGVGEYWSIDPRDRTESDNQPSGLRVRAWTLQRGRYIDLPVATDQLTSRVIAGFALDLRPLREMSGEAE
jgi:Uma2 family endonuclease